jgi:NADH-quinone oxidoreductase subunit B
MGKIEKTGKAEIVQGVEVFNGEGFQLGMLDKVIAAARANSVWPLPFATSCCGIEYMATMGAR